MLGELELGEVLGVGGFAAVFRAHDPLLQRDVAIKVLDPALALTADLESQFLSEARIVAGVEHPYIVPLYGAEARDGLLYLIMRLLPGQSLADRLASAGALPVEEAARVAHEVAQALAAAHAQGVVHRDIKPDNILLDAGGHAYVTDFGISVVTAHRGSEVSGASAGTLHYISPEQALAETVDGRADVYSLGVVLFEMLTGRLPFEGKSVAELVARHVAAPPPSVAELRPETPSALVTLTDRMLAKDRETRPTAAELVSLLAAARTPEGLLSPQAVRRRRLRRRLTIAGVALGTAVAVLWGVFAVIRGAYRLFEGGALPALDALGPAVPDSLLRAARAEGALHQGETVLFAFIPAGQTATDAMIITDTALIRRSARGARRLEMEHADLEIARTKKPEWDAARGFLIVKLPGGIRDTIYDQLSGAEVIRMMTDLRAYQAALDSTKKARESLRSP
ncbi:MAG: serine/threonine-protein kinase [Gemmatimonadales bacterium]